MLRTSIRMLTVMIAALALGAATSGEAWAGHKCPNRFFKKIKPVVGVGDSEANAQAAYKQAVVKESDKVKDDCKDCECEDEGEKCTFKYTYKTKPKCKQGAAGWDCKGWVRPGCFCMEEDEDFIAVMSGAGATSSEAGISAPAQGEAGKK
jgi:hypothetical protein